MSTMNHPQKEDLYRLPWSTNDNPIGWVEVTDICNIKCKGCYRLVMGEGHKPLSQIKEEILFLKKWRNCDNISLAGGEPVLHPDIREIIRFIDENKMKSIILTNGYALNNKLLQDLKEAGLMGFSFHIDATQTRPEFNKQDIKSEMDLNDLRLKFARMLKRFDFYAHFGITVTRKSFDYIPQFIQWAIDNAEMISGISLIIYRGLPVANGVEYFANGHKVDMSKDKLGYAVGDDELEEIQITSKDVYAQIKKYFPGYEANCYLGGTMNHTSLKWLIGNMIINNKGKIFGAYGKKAMEMAQTVHHFRNGTYLVYPKRRIGKEILLAGLVDKTARKALGNFIKYVLGNPMRFFNNVKPIGIGIVQAPDLLPDGSIDMCDDCPDMCVYDGKLVNSCRLDECRIYGDLLHIHVDQHTYNGKFVPHKTEVGVTDQL